MYHTKCEVCGKKIKYIKVKLNHSKSITSNRIKINPRPVFIIPEKPGGKYFITQHGNFIKGEVARDGIKAYEQHYCKL